MFYDENSRWPSGVSTRQDMANAINGHLSLWSAFFAYGFALEYPLIVESMTPFSFCPFLLPGKQRPPRAREGSQDRRIDVGQTRKRPLEFSAPALRSILATFGSALPFYEPSSHRRRKKRERKGHSLCPLVRILSTMSYYDATRDTSSWIPHGLDLSLENQHASTHCALRKTASLSSSRKHNRPNHHHPCPLCESPPHI